MKPYNGEGHKFKGLQKFGNVEDIESNNYRMVEKSKFYNYRMLVS